MKLKYSEFLSFSCTLKFGILWVSEKYYNFFKNMLIEKKKGYTQRVVL